MVEKDEVTREIHADAAALKRESDRGLPPLASLSARLEKSPEAGLVWRPRAIVTVGVLAAAVLLVIGAVASERFRRLIIPTRGKSAIAIEEGVKEGLAGEGFDHTSVAVERAPGSLRLEVSAGDSHGTSIEMVHELEGGGSDSTLVVELPDFHDLDHLPMPERRLAIQRRLAEQGIRATVSIVDGQLRIDADERRIEAEK
ncbi:MAG TPA: hypothetical protein VF720_04755 [Candidatus Eisenbacteria bacterium]